MADTGSVGHAEMASSALQNVEGTAEQLEQYAHGKVT